MDPGTAIPILALSRNALHERGCEIDDGRDSSRVVIAWRGYAIARPLLRPGAQEDTLNLGPSKIEADLQPVLVGRAGHVLPVSLRIASIMMPVERWTSRQTILRSMPSCAPSNGKTNMSPIRIIRP